MSTSKKSQTLSLNQVLVWLHQFPIIWFLNSAFRQGLSVRIAKNQHSNQAPHENHASYRWRHFLSKYCNFFF